MELQRAVEADYPAVVALANMAYRGEGEAAGWNSEAELIAGDRLTEARLREDLAAKPEAQLLLYREQAGEALVGTVWLEPAEAGVWYLGLLTVRPDLQDRGLGRGLLGAAEEFCRDRGALRMRMTVVNLRDTLIAWYERRGYVRTGERLPFPHEDDGFGRPLRAGLAFVVLEKVLPREV